MAAQATAIGQEIHRLRVWSGRLYVAYGDYADNTGPIHVISVDLTDATVRDEATLNTEETWEFRAHGGNLYVPYVDPQGSLDPTKGQYAVASTPGTWTVVTNVTPVPEHVFGVAETADGLFLAGSASGVAKVWRTIDAGATWTVSLSVDPVQGESRFYSIMSDGTDLLAVCEDVGALADFHTYHWPVGGPWAATGSTTEVAGSSGAYGVSDWLPFSHVGTPFFLSWSPGKQQAQAQAATLTARTLPVNAADQATIQATLPDVTVYDATVTADGLTMYLLGADLSVWRGDTTGTWAKVLTLTAGTPTVVSIAIDEANGWLYFGSTDSQILRHAIPA